MRAIKRISVVLVISVFIGIFSTFACASSTTVTLADKILGQGISLPKNTTPTESDGVDATIPARNYKGSIQSVQKRSKPDKGNAYVIGNLVLSKDRDVIVYAVYNGYTLVEEGIEFYWIKSSNVDNSDEYISSGSGYCYEEDFTTDDVNELNNAVVKTGIRIPKAFVPSSVEGVDAILLQRIDKNKKATVIDKRSAPEKAKKYDIGDISLKEDVDVELYGYYKGYALVSEGMEYYWVKSIYVSAY